MAAFVLDGEAKVEVIVFRTPCESGRAHPDRHPGARGRGRFERDEDSTRLLAAEVLLQIEIVANISPARSSDVALFDRQAFEDVLAVLGRHRGDGHVAFLVKTSSADGPLLARLDVSSQLRVRPSGQFVAEARADSLRPGLGHGAVRSGSADPYLTWRQTCSTSRSR